MQFKNDPTTETDDRLALLAARNDLISTLTGSIVSVIGALAPVVICFAPIPTEVKIASWVGGGIVGGAGAAIARQSPLKVSQNLQSQTRSSQTELDINR
jgi:hypothetical protein